MMITQNIQYMTAMFSTAEYLMIQRNVRSEVKRMQERFGTNAADETAKRKDRSGRCIELRSSGCQRTCAVGLRCGSLRQSRDN